MRSIANKTQPTGGVIVVIDKDPSKPKSLVELKAKKVVRTTPATDTVGTRNAQSGDQFSNLATGGSGAAAASGVLNSIDEDDEEGEDAPLPKTFEYESDAEDNEE